METNVSPKVLVVGAGPTGLMLALTLRRFGVPCRVIDKASGRSDASRALAIHARTLEMLDCYGLADPFLKEGNRICGINFQEGERMVGGIDLGRIPSKYPFVITVPQALTEQLLDEEFARIGQEIERPAELLSISHKNGEALCRIREKDGVIQENSYRFVVGCDGAHSTVRHCLGLDFEGSEYPEFFGLADVTVSGEIPQDKISIFLHSEGKVIFIPTQGRKFRVVAAIEGAAAEEGVTLEDLQETIDRRVGHGIAISDPTWIAGFRTHHRMTDRMSCGGVFLAGDAAHIHSPTGGQGMNTGMQDAINLGWKLAYVLRGDAPPTLLNTYEEERLPVARNVLAATDRFSRFTTAGGGFRAWATKKALGELKRFAFVENSIASEVSQVGVNYRRSSLSVDCWSFKDTAGLRAGDRVSDAALITPDGDQSTIYERLRNAGFHLFLSPETSGMHGSCSFGSARFLAEGMAKDFRGNLHIHWVLAPQLSIQLRKELPHHWVDAGGSAAHALGIQSGGLLLVRPDGYAAFRSGEFDIGRIRLSVLTCWT